MFDDWALPSGDYLIVISTLFLLEKIYVQVTYLMESAATVEREFAPLLAINDHYPKFVVSMDSAWRDNVEGVRHKYIVDFLLDENW